MHARNEALTVSDRSYAGVAAQLASTEAVRARSLVDAVGGATAGSRRRYAQVPSRASAPCIPCTTSVMELGGPGTQHYRILSGEMVAKARSQPAVGQGDATLLTKPILRKCAPNARISPLGRSAYEKDTASLQKGVVPSRLRSSPRASRSRIAMVPRPSLPWQGPGSSALRSYVQSMKKASLSYVRAAGSSTTEPLSGAASPAAHKPPPVSPRAGGMDAWLSHIDEKHFVGEEFRSSFPTSPAGRSEARKAAELAHAVGKFPESPPRSPRPSLHLCETLFLASPMSPARASSPLSKVTTALPLSPLAGLRHPCVAG